MEKVNLGKVVKLHGILGQMKISTKLDKDFDINQIKELFDENGNAYEINRIFKNTDAVVVGLNGIDLEKAKNFIGKCFYIDRELVSGKVLIEDLKESVVFVDDKKIGKVLDVQDFGAAEVFYVQLNNGRELLFPNVKDIIKSFDYKEKKLVLEKEKLKEVSDYED